MVYVGFDVGGTGVQVGVVNEKGEILCKGNMVTRTDIPVADQIQAMAQCALDTIERAGFSLDEVKSLGAGIPGVVDPRTGHIAFCPNLGWHDVDFAGEMRKHIDKPVFMDNDATVAALAENVAGVSAGAHSSVFLTLGTGVGGGIVLGGKVWSGFHGVGSEIGHMVIELDGKTCNCGNRGCLERYCSATAIILAAREMVDKYPTSSILEKAEGDPMKINAKMVFDAAKEGDQLGLLLFHDFVKALAHGIVSIIHFLDPEVIALGGGVSRAGDFLLNALREKVAQLVMYKTLPYARIELAKLGPDAGIIGAAMLGL
ncbi:MAG: ROK family protein [Clostridiales bacterium]|nr:ROK family protein [Clostridiales bacterium]